MKTPASALEPSQRPAVSLEAAPGLLGRVSAEALGTFFVVVAGLGVPLFTLPQSNPLSASLAAGLAVTAAMLAFGYLSGGHFNPAVTAGNAVAGRIRPVAAAAYVSAQVAGALLGAVTLFGIVRTIPSIADSRTAFDTVAAGFGENSVIQVPLAGVLLIEVLGAALLVAVYLGTTSERNPSRLAAPFAVGLTTAVLLQFGQAPGNAPFNPARATASAIFSNPDVLGQLWLFWVAPLVGAALAGLVFRGVALMTPAGTAAPVDGADQMDDDDAVDTVATIDGVELPGAERIGLEKNSAPAAGSDEARAFFDGERGDRGK
ncbi:MULTISPECIES: MIP/aquaporin family protein [unclassified Arthrobacter]|uniref:MIP/aquaporin family protein n=1 Tax=unclassified Arthrobacter TaxID=235627 RepID=UPI002DFC5608|nr:MULTISPECIES: aquaporin [unclassified Arthrobacter]MEC5191690.1 aquaporin Z [Arthrobacter sp. MP_M4]MEC5203380.1 aquaporin Z [Arthrobacter sp. MP_M7]